MAAIASVVARRTARQALTRPHGYSEHGRVFGVAASRPTASTRMCSTLSPPPPPPPPPAAAAAAATSTSSSRSKFSTVATHASAVTHQPTLFDRGTYWGTLEQPLGDATALPGSVFTSPDWLAQEHRSVFADSWLLIGRADEVPNVGDYLAVDAPGVGPVFVIRGKDGVVRAFANVCRHRGAVLLQGSSGSVSGGIVCPYHAWAYGLDGRLRGAPKTKPVKRGRRVKELEQQVEGMDTVAAAAERLCFAFDKKQWPLLTVRLEEYGGFLFVSGGGDDAPDLRTSLGNCVDVVLSKWPFDDMVTVGRAEYEVNCNWKFLFQNTSETYHTSYVHRDSLGPMPSSPIADEVGVEPVGDWDAVFVPGDRSVVPLPGEAAPFPVVADRTYFTNIFPSLQLNVTLDCAWWMRMLPLAVDRTLVTQGFLFPRATVESDNLPDGATFQQLVEPYLKRWDIAVREDNEISENQQRGATSALYRPGPYNGLEFATHRFDKYVVERVLRGVGM